MKFRIKRKRLADFAYARSGKVPVSLDATVLQSTHAQAVGEFFQAYRLGPQQPLSLLCIALAYIQHAMTRKVDDRNRTVLQAFAFLQVSCTPPHCKHCICDASWVQLFSSFVSDYCFMLHKAPAPASCVGHALHNCLTATPRHMEQTGQLNGCKRPVPI